jgi:predicted ATP-grasp superfamily ATP-dependent carboligase
VKDPDWPVLAACCHIEARESNPDPGSRTQHKTGHRPGEGATHVPRILITDGEQRAALAVVRSLGAAGHRCIVCSGTGRSLAGRSRHAEADLPVPDPTAAPADHGAAVLSLAEQHRVDVVIPVCEASLLAVLPLRDRIAAATPFPDLETFRAVCDKRRVLEAAEELGIRVPRQWEINAPEEAQRLHVRQPLVLKPARSVYTAADGTRGKVGVRWAADHDGVVAQLRQYPAAAFPVLAQERIVGPGIGVFVLLHRGQCLASFSHLRIREKPPSGGVSVVCRSEAMGARILALSLQLLARFAWSGVAMVEYKRDAATGEPVLMEINGRFWGSLQLAIDAGVDFPRLLVDTALGVEPVPVTDYRPARLRWFWGDVDNLIAQWRDPESGWRRRGAAAAGWIRPLGPGYREEVFRWSDPAPFLRETGDWLRAARRGLTAATSGRGP